MKQKLEFLYFTLHNQTNYIDFHKHECYELVYYINGDGCTQIDGNPHKYSANSFSIMKPYCIHDENHFNDTDVLYIGFQCNMSSLLENGIYKDDYQRSIYTYLKQMKKEVLEQKKSFSLKVDFLLGELLIELERMNGQNKKCVDLTYVLGFIDEHYNHSVDLEALAELSGYSYHRFRHLFKQITGHSPIKYILEKRLRSAAQYLEQTSLSILEISQECGFSNESQFSSMFKKYSGLTPSKHRRDSLLL